MYTADMPVNSDAFVATYADDTAVLACHESADIASVIVQNQITKIEEWLENWNIVVNSDKSTHVTFSMRHNDCPKIFINNKEIPQCDKVKYLGMHLDRRLTWRAHIESKKKQLNIKTKRMYWLIGRNSMLSLSNKLILYKTILKPIWTYGLQLWGTAGTSNIEIIQRYQSKTLRLITAAPWYVTNETIHRDLNMKYVKEEIKSYSERYLKRLHDHVNIEAILLLDDSNEKRRLKRWHVLDLPFRDS